jgi:hypothetical protein
MQSVLSLNRFLTFNIKIALSIFLAFAVVVSTTAAKSHDILFQLREAGQVSVAVYNAQGKMLRELSRGMRMPPIGLLTPSDRY